MLREAAGAASPLHQKESKMKNRIVCALMLAAGLLVAPIGHATVVKFDDLAAGGKLSSMSTRNPYSGLNWSSSWYLGDTSVAGYGAASHSGNQFLLNGFGVNNLNITSTTAFDFQGAWFATPDTNGAKASWINISAYDSANQLIGSTGQIGINGVYSLVAADFTNVYRLIISRDNGWFVMDDLAIRRAGEVDEPAALALFALGLGVLGWRRRTSSAAAGKV
jgi:uncharacterized protein (TIGR03382 family)